jgi:hypothetical protein
LLITYPLLSAAPCFDLGIDLAALKKSIANRLRSQDSWNGINRRFSKPYRTNSSARTGMIGFSRKSFTWIGEYSRRLCRFVRQGIVAR